MASAAISSYPSCTYTRYKMASLQLSFQSRTSFDTNFSKSSFSPKKTRSKSAPIIKASILDSFYVKTNTESYYDMLGILESDSIKEIKKTYKQLAKKYHPDVSPAGKIDEYTNKFIQVQEAYETLSDPKTRALYDRLDISGRSRRYVPGMGDMMDWEQRLQSQLSELIRKSNAKDFKNSSWGDRMHKRRSRSN